MKRFATILTVAILLACACARDVLPQGDWAANADYPIDVAPGGIAQIRNFVFEAPAAPGSASKIRIQLIEKMGAGAIDEDAVADAAVLLKAEMGGSGTFTYLAAVLNKNGTPKPVASVFLGDRIEVQEVRIDSLRTIQVRLLTRQPDEPMAAKPTVEVTRNFRLDGGKLNEIQP